MNGTLTAFRLIFPKRKKTGSEPSKKNKTTRAARLDPKSLKSCLKMTRLFGLLFTASQSGKVS
jgi:hypothetical protein